MKTISKRASTLIQLLVVVASLLTAGFWHSSAIAQDSNGTKENFDPKSDIISLHYDHAPDRDDGHSAAADRTILEILQDRDWIRKHTIAVSGAYGKNKGKFNAKSDAVMDAVWKDCGGWISAHRDWDGTVAELAVRWGAVLKTGGDVWVKEGGQSDITADVVRRLKKQLPGVDTTSRIHIVQHSNWNENQTGDQALAYGKKNTHYIRIRDANRYLNRKGGDASFVKAAKGHPVFGPAWKAAFDYYNPEKRLDFSDTGELMHMLGLGEIGIEAFQKRFLSSSTNP